MPVVVMIMVMVVVVVMIVPPGPVFLLLIAVQSAKVAIVAMIFDNPLMVVNSFVIVPSVIVIVVRIVGAIGSSGASCGYGRSEKSRGQQKGTEVSVSTGHWFLAPSSYLHPKLCCWRRLPGCLPGERPMV